MKCNSTVQRWDEPPGKPLATHCYWLKERWQGFGSSASKCQGDAGLPELYWKPRDSVFVECKGDGQEGGETGENISGRKSAFIGWWYQENMWLLFCQGTAFCLKQQTQLQTTQAKSNSRTFVFSQHDIFQIGKFAIWESSSGKLEFRLLLNVDGVTNWTLIPHMPKLGWDWVVAASVVGLGILPGMAVLWGPFLTTSMTHLVPRGIWVCDLALGRLGRSYHLCLVLSENRFPLKGLGLEKKLWMEWWIPWLFWARSSFEWPVWESVKFWGMRVGREEDRGPSFSMCL